MRWLFLFVLSLNLAYIGWEISKSPVEDYADVPALKNVDTIMLLSELKQQESQSLKLKQPTSPAQVEKTEKLPKLKAEAPAEKLPVSQAKPEQVVAKVNSETQVARANLESSAVKPATSVANIKPSSSEKKPSLDSSQSARCFTLGPFRNLDKLRGLTREIKSYVVAADFRGREEKEQTLYWVYLKPEKNQAKAIATGKRLKAKKIKDFYVIRDGDKINGLSLGHFRNKNGAYGLTKKVKNLGFNVIVEPVFRTYTIYWLDYQLAGGVSIPESIFEKHIKSAKKEKISRLSRNCES